MLLQHKSTEVSYSIMLSIRNYVLKKWIIVTLYIPVFHLIILNFKSKPHSMGCIRISSFLFLHLNKFYSLNINYMPGRLKVKSQMPLTYIELEFKSRTNGTNFTLLQILEVLGRWVWLKTWEKLFFGNLNSERSMVWFR